MPHPKPRVSHTHPKPSQTPPKTNPIPKSPTPFNITTQNHPPHTQTRTMKAHYQGERGIRVIRPLVYARETETRDFARAYGLPVVNENCPACFEQPKVRRGDTPPPPKKK